MKALKSVNNFQPETMIPGLPESEYLFFIQFESTREIF